MDDMLKQLRKTCGAVASAVVGKDGLMMHHDVPDEVALETFGIMSATIVGASVTAATELGKDEPSRIVVETGDLNMIIYNAGRRALLVVAVPNDRSVEDVDKSVQEILVSAKEI
ncbi:MAG: roadblock/LC7 domain-containing protein [Thermoplasmata archaeon]|nr:roadblock/LC7 domain-containing protein [Thermoplasmata archaeon]MCK4455539.1 roadblock/LC7 domain-containing protein [Thermoplasmata archaeon]